MSPPGSAIPAREPSRLRFRAGPPDAALLVALRRERQLPLGPSGNRSDPGIVVPDESPVTELGKVTLTLYLKLSRVDRQIQVFTSTDGQSWGEPMMTHTTTLGSLSHLGLFICSSNTFASSTAEFKSVTLSQ